MMERVSLRDYFADFAAENTERLAERGLILHYSPPAGPAWTAIDRMQFQRVIDNLLENALKYKEGPTVTMDLHLAETPQAVGLTAADHGPGVPAADLPRLFDSFTGPMPPGRTSKSWAWPLPNKSLRPCTARFMQKQHPAAA